MVVLTGMYAASGRDEAVRATAAALFVAAAVALAGRRLIRVREGGVEQRMTDDRRRRPLAALSSGGPPSDQWDDPARSTDPHPREHGSGPVTVFGGDPPASYGPNRAGVPGVPGVPGAPSMPGGPGRSGGHGLLPSNPLASGANTVHSTGDPTGDLWAAEFTRMAEPVPTAARRPWRLPATPAQSGLAADAALVGRLEVRAASLVGPGHRCEEPAVARQDAYRIGRDSHDRYLIVAVADGMSDSRQSDLGANVAAAAIVRTLRTSLDRGPIEALPPAAEVFLAAAREMYGAAEQRGISGDGVRAAALAAVVEAHPGRDGRHAAWLASVADVGAWRRRTGGWERLIGVAKDGMDENRLTEFLPHHPRQAAQTEVRLAPGEVLALTTDGVGDAFGERTVTAPRFADLWEQPQPIIEFVRQVGYHAPGALDDRTAVVVWCPPAGCGR